MAGTVWWTGFCGNRSQYDAFWSEALTLETANPDLPLCFQKTVLLWIPAGWMWLAAPYETFTLWTRPSKHGVWACSKLNFIKTLCGMLLTMVAALSLIRTAYTMAAGDGQPPVDLTYDIVRTLTLILVTVFVRWEFRQGVHTSGSLCVFWALYFVTQIVTLRSAAMRRGAPSAGNETEAMFAIDVAFFVLLVIEFMSSWFADVAALGPEPDERTGEMEPLLPGKHIDNDRQKLSNPLPELRASFWMKATFQWMLPSVVRGYRKTVQFEDLYDVRPNDRCSSTMPVFFRTFDRSATKEQGYSGGLRDVRCAFWKALFSTVGWPLMYALALKYLSVALFLANPLLLRLLLQHIETGDEYSWKATALAVLIFLTALVGSVVRHSFFYIGWTTGMMARSVVNAVVCRKALSIGGGSKRSTTVGEMVNFLSVDADKIQNLFTFSHLILDVPIQLTATCALMWMTIGWSASAGLALLLIIVPLNSFIFGNQVRKLQGKQMIFKDSRLKVINEILNGIKILKLYAWEQSFREKIQESREQEVRYVKYANLIGAFSHTAWCIMPYLASLAIFVVYTLTSADHILSADTAFVTIAYINTIQFSLANLPLGVTFLGQGIVSGNRIARFLGLDELREDSVGEDLSTPDSVQIEDGTFSWESEGRTILEDINLHVKPGQLVAIVGHVGAGKSSLLSTMLGEMVKVKGTVTVNGRLAYVPQQAWIRNATLRSNILFGRPFKDERYSEILESCSLTQDLKILPGEDLTEIGERGINLSGGQKQRVSLARAVYQDEDIYLLDDPLSAVDAHVGKHIFDNVIGNNGLLKDKTRILVTHAITFLEHVDLIVVLVDGQVTEMGRFNELLENYGAFADFLRTYLVEHEDAESSGTDLADLRRQLSTASGTDSDMESIAKLRRRSRSKEGIPVNNPSGPDSSRHGSGSPRVKKSKLIEEETPAEGRLKYEIIKTYVRAGGIFPCVLVVCAQILFVAAQVMTNIWLSEWTTDTPVNGTISRDHLNYRLTVYGVLGSVQALSALTLMTTAAIGCTYASRNIHASLLYRILRAPMAFFDKTPLGRIMNRFAKDMDMIDANVPLYLRAWLFATGPLLSTAVLVSYTTPIFIIVLVVLGIPFIFTQRAYIIYTSQLKRIDAVRRSPIYAHFDETVAGATSIRAYRRQKAFIAEADHLIDNSQKPYALMSAAQRWLGVTLETMGSVVILFATILSVMQKDQIGAGLAGVSITYALQITSLMNTMIRSASELETYMISVERINEYSNVDMEAPWELPDDTLTGEWPEEGAITFNQYGTRYRPGLDLVLNKLNIDIQPNEKIGVVGRTGAGKSSLTLALFRIIEAAVGSITIDGRDIADMGLHRLRSRLTVIPQDPVMFTGSVRFNVDPFGLYPDQGIWESLEHAHLKTFVASLDEGLDYECGEGGEALSVGQRQLVCLARALLRRSKVLVLDEATAAVDLETDALIQVSIRKHFKECTVITVAHRLNTVLDYDRIMVLDHGRVKEFDSPAKLLANKKTIFYGLAKEAGLTS